MERPGAPSHLYQRLALLYASSDLYIVISWMIEFEISLVDDWCFAFWWCQWHVEEWLSFHQYSQLMVRPGAPSHLCIFLASIWAFLGFWLMFCFFEDVSGMEEWWWFPWYSHLMVQPGALSQFCVSLSLLFASSDLYSSVVSFIIEFEISLVYDGHFASLIMSTIINQGDLN